MSEVKRKQENSNGTNATTGSRRTGKAGRREPRKSSQSQIKPAALPAIPDHRTPRERYLDEVAPSGVVGRLIKFTKEGKFAFNDDGEAIAESEDFVVLADETLVSWVKFNGDGEPPTRIGGLLYQGFVLPPREQTWATPIRATGRSACRASRKTLGSTSR